MDHLQGMLWYAGPLPPPVLANASCPSTALQAWTRTPARMLKVAVMLAQGTGTPSFLHAVSISTADAGGVGRRQQLAKAKAPVSAQCFSRFPGCGMWPSAPKS